MFFSLWTIFIRGSSSDLEVVARAVGGAVVPDDDLARRLRAFASTFSTHFCSRWTRLFVSTTTAIEPSLAAAPAPRARRSWKPPCGHRRKRHGEAANGRRTSVGAESHLADQLADIWLAGRGRRAAAALDSLCEPDGRQARGPAARLLDGRASAPARRAPRVLGAASRAPGSRSTRATPARCSRDERVYLRPRADEPQHQEPAPESRRRVAGRRRAATPGRRSRPARASRFRSPGSPGSAAPQVVYVESLARIEGPSLTYRLIAPIASRRYVQWPELAEALPSTRFAGNVFSAGA